MLKIKSTPGEKLALKLTRSIASGNAQIRSKLTLGHEWPYVIGDTMYDDAILAVIQKLDRIEAAVTQILGKRPEKEWYTTAEVAEIMAKAEYTVREWCRQGRVRAAKTTNGRGWIVSHEELTRVRNHGPLPIPKHGSNGVVHGARD